MTDINDLNGKVVAAYLMSDSESKPHFMGELVGYYACPTALIDTGDGLHPHAWAASLIRAASHDEEINFWKERALKAEKKLGGAA